VAIVEYDWELLGTLRVFFSPLKKGHESNYIIASYGILDESAD